MLLLHHHNSANGFFVASSENDPPIIFSIPFDDIIYMADDNQMWFRTTVGGHSGWLVTPYAYDSGEPYPIPNIRSINTHDFILWEPASDSLKIFIDSPDSVIADPTQAPSQPLARIMSDLELELHIESEIYWHEGEPYFNVYLASQQGWETFCRQLEKPVASVRGWVPMFDPADEMSVSEVQLGLGYCD